MSWLSSALGDVGSAVKGIGHAAGTVLSNPIVDAGLTFIPGVGPVAAGLAGAAGGLLKPGGNIGSALTSGAEGALAGGGAQSLAGLLGGGAGAAGAAGQAAGGVGGMAGSAVPGVAGAAQGAGSSPGILGSIEGLAGKAGGLLTGNGGANALGAVGALSSYLNQNKANDYAKQALGSVEQSYNERAPLRAQGLASLANSQSGNPFTRGS